MPSLVRRIGMPCLTLHLPNGTVTIHSSRRARFERARRVIVVAIFKSVLPHPVITHPTPSTCARRNTRPQSPLAVATQPLRLSYTPLSAAISLSRSTKAVACGLRISRKAVHGLSAHDTPPRPATRYMAPLRALRVRDRTLLHYLAAQSLRESYSPLLAAPSLTPPTRPW